MLLKIGMALIQIPVIGVNTNDYFMSLIFAIIGALVIALPSYLIIRLLGKKSNRKLYGFMIIQSIIGALLGIIFFLILQMKP